MPHEQRPHTKRRHRLGINRKKPVRVKGPGWVYLNDQGNAVTVVYDNPVDSAPPGKLSFSADPAPHTNISSGD
jgi:hypothetical protein